ncbi:hypothetical protein FO519_004668 [Halicephalobus sp. NKZ332]|nr:hypothetical protein FO519_004668 [Halicephalobus sp. NKZ332]
MNAPPKRKDIQWLRGLAISTVFFFHLVPEYCGQGYLGVDVFFVISGYLMTRILYNSKKPSFLKTTTSQFKFLLHTWSLSVEVQYYLIAPLLCFILHRTYNTHFISSILFFSLFLQWTLRGTTFGFDLLLCRLWQFLVGTIAFLSTKEKEVALEPTGQPRDISYSLYLVHWPVILFGRYSNNDSNTFGFVFIIAMCVVAAVLLYEFLDKTIPTKTAFVVFIQTGVVFGIILVICFYSPSLKSSTLEQKIELPKDLGANLSIEEIIKMNEKFGATCQKPPIQNCHSDPTISRIYPEFHHSEMWSNNCVVDFNENGTKTVALLGNSYASRFSITAVEVLKEFPSVKKMYFISRAACSILDILNAIGAKEWHCEELMEKNMAFVKEVKPDIIINMARYNHISRLNVPITDPESLQNDIIVLAMKNELAEYEKYTDKIIFFESSPVVINSTFQGPGNLARILTFSHSLGILDSLFLPREAVERDLTPAWTRIKAGIADCKKCVVIPTLDLFCGKTKCPVTEASGLSRYCDNYHLSEAGTNLMLPSLKNVLSRIL